MIIPRELVESKDTTVALMHLSVLKGKPKSARTYREVLDLRFGGYDDTTSELFEIEEVRDFMRALDDGFLYWLYFMSKNTNSLQAVILCFLPPFLTAEEKAKHFPKDLDTLLTKRWIPAMNHMCEFAGLSEQETLDMSDRAMDYIQRGPRQ